MTELLAGYAGALIWLVIYRRYKLKYTSIAAVMFPMALVLAIKGEWWLAFNGFVPGMLGILVDLWRARRKGHKS